MTEDIQLSLRRMTRLVSLTAALMLFAETVVSAAGNAVWNPQWKQQVELSLKETAGISRTNEPVDVEIEFSQPWRDADVTNAVKRELRVIRREAEEGMFREVPSQVYDIRVEGKIKSASPTPVKVRVAFLADVPSNAAASYLVAYDNPDAALPDYPTPLQIKGGNVEYTIDNTHYRIITAPTNGQIDQIDLKFASKPSLRFKFGALHWNPDFIVAPPDFPTNHYHWYYAHNFEYPEHEVESGPVFFSIKRRQLIPGQDIVYMEVGYRFYAGLPYFLMESLIETKKDTRSFAVRNDELAFGRKDFTHIGWRNRSPEMFEYDLGELGSAPVMHEARVPTHVLGNALPPNMPWISLAHLENGYGVGSVRLEWENVNVLTGKPSPLYNSHTVISEHGEGLYWFRSLVYTSSRGGKGTEKFLVSIPKGSSYREKNAYAMYESSKEKPFAAMDELYFQLRKPLQVSVVRK